MSGASWKLDIDAIRAAAAGRWKEILVALTTLTHDHLSGRHQPCPRCGGNDRFRAFDDVAELGGMMCNQCFSSRNGDGFSTLQWLLGIDFIEAARRVNDYLGHPGGRPAARPAGEARDPAANLEFLPWNRLQAALWCRHKPPVTVEGLESCHARLARYRGQWPVMALPIFGRPEVGDASIVGWAMFALNGGTLPVYRKGQEPEWKKVKLAGGSSAGFIGQVDHLAEGKEVVWKVEGLSDLLALTSLPLPANHAVITNAFGSKEDPAKLPPSLLDTIKDATTVYVVHDCDQPGQDGAKRWASTLAKFAPECRNVVLPLVVRPGHKDLRDWLNAGGNFEKLVDLAIDSERIVPSTASPEIHEADNDPHKLARANLRKMRANGRDLKFWRDEWYVWKGAKYRKITVQEFRAKLTQSIKDELNAAHLEEYERWNRGDKAKPAPVAKHVTPNLINAVIQATSGMVVVSSSVEPMTWLPDRSRRHYVSMANGLLDLDEVLADGDDYLLPHSPDWFSTVSLPYEYSHKAQCPKWLGFLNRNLAGNKQQIAILQEWAGYLLLPDTGQQKFLMLEGEGANGKSVYLAAITAMLGEENVENIPLEIFGDRFSRTQTLGKLANVSGDVGEMDKAAEGYIKGFTSGDRMYFDRKGISGISCCPTARLMLACNNRPHFSDRSSGLWRRMILVPFTVTIPEGERIPNMDKVWWWKDQGELPGIFWWALQGLARLRKNGRFTESDINNKAIADYQRETNTARAFLEDFVEEGDPENDYVRTAWIYRIYQEWCKANGVKPFGDRQFGKEVSRKFPNSKRDRMREKKISPSEISARHYVYFGLNISSAKIAEMSTHDKNPELEKDKDEKNEFVPM